ncbi:hypothetical protein CR513_36134, partial [Mucuna pruriens]
MKSVGLFAHFSASSSSSLCFLLSLPLDSSPSSTPCFFRASSLFHPNMSSPQGSDVESKSQPIPLSSSESKALTVMLESVAVAKGTPPQPFAPIVPLPQHAREHYEWVSEEVLSYRLDVVRSYVNLLMVEGEQMCHAAQKGEGDFIYMYKTAFKDLGVSLPFDCFAADVLRTLGVAPSQLQPNNWAAMQAFRVGSPWPHSPREAYSMLKRPLTRVSKTVLLRFVLYMGLPLPWTLNPFHCTRGCPPRSRGCPGGNLPRRTEPRKNFDMVALIKKVAQASKGRASSLAPASQGTASMKDRLRRWLLNRRVPRRCRLALPRLTLLLAQRGWLPLPLRREPPKKGATFSSAPAIAWRVALFRGSFNSLWGLGLDTQALLPSNFISQHNRGLLLSTGIGSSLDAMAAYCVHTLAIIDVLRSLVNKSKQLVLKESISRRDCERLQQENMGLRVENQKLKTDAEKIKVENEMPKADSASSKSEVVASKTKTTAFDLEITKLRTMRDTLTKDLDSARARNKEMEVASTSDKTALQFVKDKLGKATEKINILETEVQSLISKLNIIEGAIMEQHQDGFDRALW